MRFESGLANFLSVLQRIRRGMLATEWHWGDFDQPEAENITVAAGTPKPEIKPVTGNLLALSIAYLATAIAGAYLEWRFIGRIVFFDMSAFLIALVLGLALHELAHWLSYCKHYRTRVGIYSILGGYACPIGLIERDDQLRGNLAPLVWLCPILSVLLGLFMWIAPNSRITSLFAFVFLVNLLSSSGDALIRKKTRSLRKGTWLAFRHLGRTTKIVVVEPPLDSHGSSRSSNGFPRRPDGWASFPGP